MYEPFETFYDNGLINTPSDNSFGLKIFYKDNPDALETAISRNKEAQREGSFVLSKLHEMDDLEERRKFILESGWHKTWCGGAGPVFISYKEMKDWNKQAEAKWLLNTLSTVRKIYKEGIAAAEEITSGVGELFKEAEKVKKQKDSYDSYLSINHISIYSEKDFGDGRMFFKNDFDGTKSNDREVKRVLLGPTPDFSYLTDLVVVRSAPQAFKDIYEAKEFIVKIVKDNVVKVTDKSRYYLPIIGSAFSGKVKYLKFDSAGNKVKE